MQAAVFSKLPGFGAWPFTFGIEEMEGRLPEAIYAAVTIMPCGLSLARRRL